MENLVHGIHHIAMKYDGLEKYNEALHFFCDILGMKLLRTWGEGEKTISMVDTGNGILEIFAGGHGLEHGMINHIALAVKDVDLCIETVRKEGYEVIIEPKTVNFATAEPYTARLGFCKGPAGEQVEFFCEM